MQKNEALRHRRQQVQDALACAIQMRDFQLCYQGQNRLSDAKLVGFEALCRLRTPALGDVPPDEFIPIAEDTGLIDQLEGIVLDLVARDIPELLAHHPDARIGVNLSARHMAQTHFFSTIHEWLAALPAQAVKQLDFEITETCFQLISPSVVEGLHKLRKRGIRIVMDDFGSGQSSLSRLHTLPFDVIKLDKQFAKQLDHPMVHAIVKMTIDFAHQFDIGLVIEGVETQQQCQELAELGGHIAQGFLFGKPAPLHHWLQQQ